MAKIHTDRTYFPTLIALLIAFFPNRASAQTIVPPLDSVVFGPTAARGHARCELRKVRDCVTKTYTLSAWQVQGANQEQVQAAWNTGDFGHSIVVSPPGFFSWDASPFTCDHFLNSTNIPAFFPEPTLEILGAQAICPGEEVVLTLNDDGYPFQSFQWNPIPFIPILSPYTVTSPGAYSLTVTDLNGCTYTDQVVIPQSPPVNPNILGTLAMCSTGSTNTLSVTPSFSNYQWSNGASTNPITVSDPGGYSVTVTNQFGCTNSVDFEVANADIDEVVVNVSAATICPGESDTLRVFGFFNQYRWSTGAVTSSIIVTQPGTYTVTVTNAFGCTGERSIAVTAAPVPAPTLAAASICPGAATVLMPGGGGFSQYKWSNGQTASSITTSQPGTYTVTVTNAVGCTASVSASVLAAPAANVAISGPAQICAPQSGVLAASPGLAAYTWSTGATTSSIPVGQSGTFTVTVSNGAGCTATASQTFTVNPQPNPTANAAPYNCNGQIALNASGNFAQYQWSSGASTASTSVTQSGTYTVTVTTAAGCSNTAETTANIPPPPLVGIAGSAQLCVDVVGQLTASGNFAQYRWSLGGQTTPTIAIPQPGTYTVTVTDAFGCTDTETHVVALAPPLQTNIAGPSQICINSTGQLTATGSFANYTWSTGAATQSISVSQSGNYTVTVSDLQGCTGTAVHALVVSTALIPQITPAPYSCNLKITLSAGLGFASYQWSDGSTMPGIVVGSNGTYSVTVTDATGCSGTASEVVNIPALPQVGVAGAAAFCTGLTGLLTTTGGTFAQYAWTSGGQPVGSNATLSVSQSGAYTIVVTDANGCTASATQNVVVHPLPQPVISGPTSICIGNSATFAAGNFAQYIWSTGSTAQSINTTQSGTYTVTVTDVNGCTGVAARPLSVAASLAPIITPESYQCDGRVQISAGTGFTTYNWSNGQPTAGISVQNAGTYTVTVSDASGCTGTAEQTVTIPANPQASISGPTDLCPAEQGQLLANAGLAQYDWTGGLTGQIVSVSQTGIYVLTVTDFNGCTATSGHVIVPSPNLQTAIAGPLQICIGGTGTLSANGNFAQYAWSTGGTGASIATQNPGTYTVTVTNTEGCTGSAQHVLNVGTSLAPQIVASSYQCDGKISISAGLGFDDYLWSNGATTSSIAVQNDGSFSVTVSDATGCTGTAVQSVTIPTPPNVDIAGPNALCLGVAGPLAATTGFVGYQWSTGATTSTASVLPPGVFTVTVTDAFGCTDAEDFTVVLKPSLVPTLSGPPQVCFGASGNLTVNQNFEQYLWSTGATTQAATVSATGNYTVTVTDDEGCTGTGARAILVMPQLVPTIAGPTSICAGETATLTANGGPFIDTYDWSTMATTKNITVSLIGSYSVTVTDVNGCTGTDDYQLVVYLNNQTFVERTSCHVQDTGIVVKVLPNQFGCDSTVTTHTSLIPPPVTFLTKGSCFAADTGVVRNIVLTAQGCDSIVVTHTELWPQVAASASVSSNHNGQQISCFGGSDGAASVVPTSGTAPFSAIWSTGAAGLTAQNLAAGSYFVTVTDANGCRAATAVELVAPPPLSRSILLKEVQCFEKGGITVGYVAGGTAPYSLVCNGETAQTNGSTAVTFGQLLPGTYTVEITDANGCTLASPATLVPPTADVQLLIGDTVWAYRGHEVQLVLPAGFDTLADFEWKKSPALSCLVCPSPVARLWKNEDFTASYTGYGDCEVVGLVPARVKPDPGFYVPNVIQTEDDDNGTFTIFGGPELLNIRLLRVFTRWGELVQELRDFPPNGPTGWKGDFRGQFVAPGVYVFYAEIELANGETKALKGDVTVIR